MKDAKMPEKGKQKKSLKKCEKDKKKTLET